MTTLEQILDSLGSVRKASHGWTACCPAHDDQTPSLSVTLGEDDRILLHCHAGCLVEVIVEALGLTLQDLMPDNRASTPGRHARKSSNGNGPSSTPFFRKREERHFDNPALALAELEKNVGPCTGQWSYEDQRGDVLFLVARLEKADGKTFRPISRNGRGWIIGSSESARPLYKLKELANAKQVFICEGEKAADAIRTLGLVATTSSGGCKAAAKSDWSPLAGKDCVILPDADNAGEGYADVVARILRSLPKPATVRILRLPDLPEKGDAVEFVASRAAREPGDIKAEVCSLAEAAPIFAPEKNGRRPEPVLLRLSDIEPESVHWLWPDRIALGKVTLLVGNPGLGKSFVTLDIAARVSTGQSFPGCEATANVVGGTVLLSAEDDPADTMVPRLIAAGADRSRINLLKAVRRPTAAGSLITAMFDLTRDLAALEAAIDDTEDCRLAIIDPITAYLGDTDSHKNSEVRAVMATLAELAARRKIAIVLVTHLRKGEGQALHRVMGSIGFTAAARSVYAITPDPADPDSPRRFMLDMKCNIAARQPGLSFELRTDAEGAVPSVSWSNSPISTTAEQALGTSPASRNGAEQEAIDWLIANLRDGPRPGGELKEQAAIDGIALRTLERAKTKLKVECKPNGFRGGWIWGLPCQSESQSPPIQPEFARFSRMADSADLGGVWSEST